MSDRLRRLIPIDVPEEVFGLMAQSIGFAGDPKALSPHLAALPWSPPIILGAGVYNGSQIKSHDLILSGLPGVSREHTLNIVLHVQPDGAIQPIQGDLLTPGSTVRVAKPPNKAIVQIDKTSQDTAYRLAPVIHELFNPRETAILLLAAQRAGISHREIAKTFGTTLDAVNNIIYRNSTGDYDGLDLQKNLDQSGILGKLRLIGENATSLLNAVTLLEEQGLLVRYKLRSRKPVAPLINSIYTSDS